MNFIGRHIPSWQNALLSLLAAVLLILAFPDFELWFLAWFALVPLMWAIERQKQSVPACFLLGWLFGTAFFFGTCWWLAYAPIHYAPVPWPIAYLLIFIACLGAGIFPGIFALILSVLLRRFGSWTFLAAPLVWVFSEFLRYWLTGNNWNAVGYSQAFTSFLPLYAAYGGVGMLSFVCVTVCSGISLLISKRSVHSLVFFVVVLIGLAFPLGLAMLAWKPPRADSSGDWQMADIVALQPNVPMSGLNSSKLKELRQRQIDLAETKINEQRTTSNELPLTVILPESPMNFMYHEDREFQQFIGEFAKRNNVSVLFNSAEPDPTNGRYFNSAVMVGADGREAVQYDKIYLLPFGEAVPQFLDGIVPGFVGNFSYGGEYDLFPVGEAKAGVMICFESHFGQLSREYVGSGADVIVEMTNDGYLGPTPVLRQHLANAVFRAVETNRPVLRVTNVGITAYIDERGNVHDPLPSYTEGTRVWTVSKSDGSQTFYVKYGDWFAWLCTTITAILLAACLRHESRQRRQTLKPRV